MEKITKYKNNGFYLSLIAFIILFALLTCNREKEIKDNTPIKLIFDTDMGSDCDDVGALALLHAYMDDGKAELLACIYSSGKVPYGAGIVDAINTYYGRGEIPVGAYHRDDVGDPIDKMSAEKLAKDTSAFGNDIVSNYDAPEQTELLRKILCAQEDSSVTYITVGHTKGIYDLLVSKGDHVSPLNGFDLVKQKVKRWIAVGGVSLDESYFVYDWNFSKNGSAPYTKYTVERWPVKAVFIYGGEHVFMGKNLKNTPPGNIVRTAYRDWLWWWGHKTLDDQRLSGDLLAVYYAVEGLGDFLEAHRNGRLEVNNDGGTKWHLKNDNPKQIFVSQIAGTDSLFELYLGKLVARTPKVRR